jgi:microcystin-dependent protein
MSFTMPARPSWALVAVVAAVAFFVPQIAGADHGSAGRTLTGCLKGDGTLVKVDIGESPTSGCLDGQTKVHIADGDITAVAAGVGLNGGSDRGNAPLGLKASYRLPQGCDNGQVGKWRDSEWQCGNDRYPDETARTGGVNGDTQAVNVLDPYLNLNCIISLFGVYPSSGHNGSDTLVGEIKWVPWSAELAGWVPCEGQTLLIAENETLFQLLGTTYGGDGIETFRLPDARNRSFRGAAPSYTLGEQGGGATRTLSTGNMPSHKHAIP